MLIAERPFFHFTGQPKLIYGFLKTLNAKVAKTITCFQDHYFLLNEMLKSVEVVQICNKCCFFTLVMEKHRKCSFF